MADITLQDALKSINAGVSENNTSDATLGNEYVELYDPTTGEAVDKQPMSRLASMMVDEMMNEDNSEQIARAVLNWKQDKYQVFNHGTADTTFALTANCKHVWGVVSSLTLTLATPTPTTINGVTVPVVNEYYFQFDSGSTATTLNLPSTVKWNGDQIPQIAANTRYQINIEDNIATVALISLS